jgi:hypothetical protein
LEAGGYPRACIPSSGKPKHTMKKADAFKAIEAGEPILIGEYRSHAAETINYRDKTTGRMAELVTLSHNIEFGPRSVKIRERVEENFKPDQYKSPFKKGSRVAVVIDSFTREKGVYSGSGKVEALEE